MSHNELSTCIQLSQQTLFYLVTCFFQLDGLSNISRRPMTIFVRIPSLLLRGGLGWGRLETFENPLCNSLFGGILPHIRGCGTPNGTRWQQPSQPLKLCHFSASSRASRRAKLSIQRHPPVFPPVISADKMQIVQFKLS